MLSSLRLKLLVANFRLSRAWTKHFIHIHQHHLRIAVTTSFTSVTHSERTATYSVTIQKDDILIHSKVYDPHT